ncbi:PIN domain-containing protein [Inquilinus limosus]|uniref:PIN domain-containing protein n=1 Tax=Inquilinus limosus TaxID=171674 RepID=UPI0004154D39|nr:PIN domain-containing protein [Inquilinus limosus]
MGPFLDTNILLYSISNAAEESEKRDRALALLDRDDCVLSVQVLQEFYAQATRASRPDPLPHEIAAGLIRTWLRFRIQENTVAILETALEIKALHQFSYWDSAIIAAARAAGCRELFSEDLSHGRTIEGVTVINPFR